MKTKYAVLNGKLLPVDVAKLLLSEASGPDDKSVQIVFGFEQYPGLVYLEKLLAEAEKIGINHSFKIEFISEMILKLIRNNTGKDGNIVVKILQGSKTFLFAYFME